MHRTANNKVWIKTKGPTYYRNIYLFYTKQNQILTSALLEAEVLLGKTKHKKNPKQTRYYFCHREKRGWKCRNCRRDKELNQGKSRILLWPCMFAETQEPERAVEKQAMCFKGWWATATPGTLQPLWSVPSSSKFSGALPAVPRDLGPSVCRGVRTHSSELQLRQQ